MVDLAEPVRRYYSTVDTAGADEVVALFTQDAVYRRPGYEPLRGRAELARFYGGVRVIASGRHTLDELVIEGARAAVRGQFRGVLRVGSQVQVGFADFMRFEGELIAERTTYFYTPAI